QLHPDPGGRIRAPVLDHPGLAMTKPPARPADDMTAEEVKQFWHGLCERKKTDPAIRARRDQQSHEHPAYLDGPTLRQLGQAGDSFFVPAGVVHDGKNVGSGPAKVLATYVVEKGKPVASPAK